MTYFSFYLLNFSFTKLEDRRMEQVLFGGLAPVEGGRGEEVGKE
jgi:hypothetical protein